MSISDLFGLKSKKALVTGGASGIGKAYCEALADAGADVAIGDKDYDAARKVCEELLSLGVKSIPIQVDISNAEDVDRMVNQVVGDWGRLDIAVNNAGISHRDNAEELAADTWDRVMNTNLRGSFLCAQREAKVMIPQKYGKIIFTTSISSRIINIPQLHVAYGASKAGIEHLVKDLGYEWIKYGINVNGISPGATYTPFVVNRLAELIPDWEKLYPIGRLGYPEDFKAAVVYLASDASSFMVGHCMVIDGGYTLV
jgi:NAD(P)-dependent dehydrogenase (short-subunit alcohol dehydrogenase family)